MPSVSNVRAGGAYVEIGGQTKQLDMALSKANLKLKKFAQTTSAMGTKMLKFGALMAAPVAIGIKAISSFQDQMANVSTMLDDQSMKYMPEYSKAIQDMSVQFGESTDTIAGGLYDILSASIEPAKALDVLTVSMKAAQAGMTDTKTAADAITTILNSYGLEADKASSVSDLLFATVKRGKTTFAELAPSIGMVASTASKAGLPMEEMAAMLAVMTRNGVRTRVAVTALNAILGTFLDATPEAQKAAKDMGFELNTTTLKTMGLVGVMEKMQGASAEQVAAIFKNKRAIRGILPALGDMEGFMTDLNVATERTGLTEVAFGKMTETLGFQLRQLGQNIVGFFRDIGMALAGETSESVKGLNETISLTRDWIKENGALIRTVAKIALGFIAIGGALFILGKAMSIVQATILIIKTIYLVLAGLSTVIAAPWLIVLGIVLAIIGFLAYALGWFDDLAEIADDIFGKVPDWVTEGLGVEGAGLGPGAGDKPGANIPPTKGMNEKGVREEKEPPDEKGAPMSEKDISKQMKELTKIMNKVAASNETIAGNTTDRSSIR